MSLELAQSSSRVALAWHLARRGTPFGVTGSPRSWTSLPDGRRSLAGPARPYAYYRWRAGATCWCSCGCLRWPSDMWNCCQCSMWNLVSLIHTPLGSTRFSQAAWRRRRPIKLRFYLGLHRMGAVLFQREGGLISELAMRGGFVRVRFTCQLQDISERSSLQIAVHACCGCASPPVLAMLEQRAAHHAE